MREGISLFILHVQRMQLRTSKWTFELRLGILQCWSILYARHLFYVCLSCERDPSHVALPAVSSIFFPVKRVFLGEFFLIPVEHLRTECVTCCTDCEAPWFKFVICDIGFTIFMLELVDVFVLRFNRGLLC